MLTNYCGNEQPKIINKNPKTILLVIFFFENVLLETHRLAVCVA